MKTTANSARWKDSLVAASCGKRRKGLIIRSPRRRSIPPTKSVVTPGNSNAGNVRRATTSAASKALRVRHPRRVRRKVVVRNSVIVHRPRARSLVLVRKVVARNLPPSRRAAIAKAATNGISPAARRVQAVRAGGVEVFSGGSGAMSVAPLSRRQKSFLLVCSCLPSVNLRFDADL